MLKELGVEEFESAHFRVKFSPMAIKSPPEQREAGHDYKQPQAPQSMWDHPSLWPGGKPPEFIKKDK